MGSNVGQTDEGGEIRGGEGEEDKGRVSRGFIGS